MKHKLLFGIMALVMGVFMAGCSDDEEYTSSKTPLLTDDSVVTGSADVTATGATLHGTVKGLESQSENSYEVGFYYGSAADALTESVKGASGAAFSASISGTPGDVIYYQAFVTLQGIVTKTGSVEQCVLTNATATTGAPTDLTAYKATISGTLANYPDDAESGVILSSMGDTETEEGIELVRAGVRVPASELGTTINATALGLVPGTTYYYCAYLDLGSGVVYGDALSFTTPQLTEFNVDDEFVDLGLSVKWSKCNIGGESETDLGGLFGFGDIAGYKTSIDPEDYATSDTYKSASDVAYFATKGVGMLPTADEFEELVRSCTKTEEEIDGVKGIRFTSNVEGYTDKSIFIPYAGSRTQGETTGVNTIACYMTGSACLGNTGFSYAYKIDNAVNGRVSMPTFTALPARAVTVAKNVPFDKTKLYQKWYMDNGQDGKQHVFQGPFTQYGAHDTYGTITNNEPNPYESIHWEMGTDNGRIGYTYGTDYGYMEFKEDGTYLIHRSTDGTTFTDEEGTYTIDETNKTITIDKDVLCGTTWLGTKSGTLNILSLTENQLQIALPAGDGTYAYSVNYYSETKKEADEEIVVGLGCCGSDWSGIWGDTMQTISPAELDGQHTFTWRGYCKDAMIQYIDIAGLSRYPNAIVIIDEIKCDGNSIKFDANKFYYGYSEGNDLFRVTLFNIYGLGSSNGVVLESPFSNKTNVGSDDAFSFNSSLEVTYTIITEPTFYPTFITINPSWGGPWDYSTGEQFNVTVGDDYKYVATPNSFDVKYESAEHAAGSIMTFVQINNLFKYFPSTHATLDDCLLDGSSVSYDKSMVVDTSDGDNYRLELWNMYGATSTSGCGFGTPVNGTVKELGFNSSIEVKYTINSLFATPEW